MKELPEVHNGREEILKFFKEKYGITSWQTVRFWRRNYGFPIRYYPNEKPYLIESEAIQWAINYDDLRRKAEKEENAKKN